MVLKNCETYRCPFWCSLFWCNLIKIKTLSLHKIFFLFFLLQKMKDKIISKKTEIMSTVNNFKEK